MTTPFHHRHTVSQNRLSDKVSMNTLHLDQSFHSRNTSDGDDTLPLPKHAHKHPDHWVILFHIPGGPCSD